MTFDSEFEASRPRLLAVAHRLLGSVHDAEDAVQTAWLRAQSASVSEIDNPVAWLTTVVTRVCLDQLRDRRRRELLTARVDPEPEVISAADEDFLRRQDISRALMVLLGVLTPPQRVAYVLHDLFSVPFDQIAGVLDTTASNAKKHASRARARLRPASHPVDAHDSAAHDAIVTAFLRAASGGDLDGMLALMAPDCVRTVDPSLVAPGTATEITGAAAVARETRGFADRIRAATPMRVNGRDVHVIAPGGRPWAVIDITTAAGLISRIAIAPVRDTDLLEAPAQADGKWDL